MKKIRLMLFMALMAVMSIVSMGEQTINFKVDMTVLWGGNLPKAVYVLPQRVDKGSDSDLKQNGAWIYLNYDQTKRDDGTEQDIMHAIKLIDAKRNSITGKYEYDGIYEGSVVYSGEKRTFNSRLYVAKEDENNTMKNPIYEVNCNKVDVNKMGWDKRQFTVDGGSTLDIKWAWEEKDIKQFEGKNGSINTGAEKIDSQEGTITLQSEFSQRLVLDATFNNDDGVNRDVARYVTVVSGDRNIADIVKVIDSKDNINYVKIVAKGKAGESTTLELSVGNPRKIYKLKVKIVDSVVDATKEQLLVLKPANKILNTDSICIDEKIQSLNNEKYHPLPVGLTSNPIESITKSSYDFLNFVKMNPLLPSYKEGYSWWLPGAESNGVLIPMIGVSGQEVSVKIKKESSETEMRIHVPTVANSSAITINTGAEPSFEWNEIEAENAIYTKRYMIVRIARINTNSENIKYDPYNMKNPIVSAEGNTNVISKFNEGTLENGYIDYVFAETGTKISSDGRAVKREEDSKEVIQKITIMDFPVGQYKTQIYSIKGNDTYSIVTFEMEKPFEITKEDFEEANQTTDDTYIINEVNPSKFDEINVNFTTKTQDIISEESMSQKIFSDELFKELGIKEYKRESSTGKYEVDGKKNKENITVKKLSKDTTAMMPLDIVLCLDRSKSMSGKMQNIKDAWKDFELKMNDKGYSVKYKMVSFGGKDFDNKFETTSDWADKLSTQYDSNFSAQSEDEKWAAEQSREAIDKAITVLDDTGRYYGYDKSNSKYGPLDHSNKTEIPSKKVIVFITDGNPNVIKDVNDFEEKIRKKNLKLIGIGAVKDTTGNKLFFDPLGNKAEESEKHKGGGGYYDLKILLGGDFKWYQIVNDKDKIFKELMDGFGSINSTALWQLTYKTPYPECDVTFRKVNFYIKNDNNNQISYKGTESDRIYKSPSMAITVKISTPKTNEVFLESNGMKYEISGIAFGKIKFDNPDIDKSVVEQYRYRNLEKAKLIIKKSGTENLIKLDDAKSKEELWNDFKDNKEKLSGGELGYKFKFEVPQENFIDSGAELFDVWVYAYMKPVGDSNWSCEPGSDHSDRVKADVDPPKVIEVSMYNETAANSIKYMQESDKTNEVFDETTIVNLNTILYQPFTSDNFKSETGTTAKVQNFSDRKDKDSKDGRFVKNGSKIHIKTVIIDANMDLNGLNSELTKNVLKASFTNLGTTGYIVPDAVIVGKSIKVGNDNVNPIVAEWTITVSNDTDKKDVIANMNILAIDKYANSNQSESKVTNRLGNIQIAKIDNTRPGLGSFVGEIKAMKGSYGLYSFKTDGNITKDPYGMDVNISSDELKDNNGIRAFKVYYTYDSKFSDYGTAGRTGTAGNHDKDKTDGGLSYFYIKAGDAINLDANDSIEVVELKGSAIKEPIKTETNHNDDGKYIFKIAAVDKAGNETDVVGGRPMILAKAIEDKSFGSPKTIYVDTQAPSITNILLKKVDKIGEDNYVKNGAKVYITALVKDYSAMNSEEYYKKSNGTVYTYPKYSSILTVAEDPKIIFKGYTLGITADAKAVADLRIGQNPEDTITVNSTDGLKTITVGARDLAGNEATVEFEATVDNTINTPVIKAWSVEGKNKSFTGVETQISDIDGKEPTSTNVHYSKFDNYILSTEKLDDDVVNASMELNTVKKDVVPAEISGKDYTVNKTGEVVFNYLNKAKLTVTDKAGNTATSEEAKIVLDNRVGNGNSVILKETTANYVSGNKYNVKLDFSGTGEYAGIWKFTLNGKYIGKGSGDKSVKVGFIPSTAEKTWSISDVISLDVPNDKIGTIINVPGVLMDNLGNTRTFNYRVLIPGKDVRIKSRDERASKEIRTRVRVIDANGKVNLQQTEETGKSVQ